MVYEAILAGSPPFPEHFSKRLVKFLTALLERDPERRLSAGEARQESWLEGILFLFGGNSLEQIVDNGPPSSQYACL